MRCEYDPDPRGVDEPHPRLFWKLAGHERGLRQTAYQIQVASSLDRLAQQQPDLWDTGKIVSEESIHIRYQGAPLQSSQRVFWRVRVWDHKDRPSDWSTNASWIMGILRPDEWRGQWICAPAETEALILRKEFEVRPGLKRAVAHVCGLGHYEMFLNGTRVGEDLFTPGWTDYRKTTLYDTYEVTGLLKSGRNAVGVMLGNGMYHVVRRHRFAKFTGSFGPLRAILHLRLEYEDGAVEFVGTDPTWRVHPGPITYSSIYGGEDYDARHEPHGWKLPGFDDRSWTKAVAIVRPAATLKGHSASALPIRAIQIHQPTRVQRLAADRYVYDLGQNASWMPRLHVRGPAGSAVRLIPAEVLHNDGTIDRRTMGSPERGLSWWQYTLKGMAPSQNNPAKSGTETWFPQFYYVGCRYLEAHLLPAEPGGPLPEILSLEGVLVHSISEPVGQFECSNDLINQIHRLVRWAQRANMMSILTDCPHREKLGWLEQAHLNGPSLRYEFDLGRLFSKVMHDMADAQLPNGLVPNIAPEYTVFDGPFRAAAEWGSAFIQVPWQQYLFYADEDLLRRNYDRMKQYFAWMESHAEQGLLAQGLGDWCDWGPERVNRAELTPPLVTATAFYYFNALTLARIARRLGYDADARTLEQKAQTIRAACRQAFWDPDRGTFATGSQAAHAIALELEWLESNERPLVLASLLRDLTCRGYAMTAGGIGFRFLVQALARSGYSDVVFRMIHRTDAPGYGYQLAQGATALTEFWDARRTGSHNHFMLGHIVEWFYKDLAGIDCDPEGPGFKQILMRPSPVGDLHWVRARYHSIRGMIESHWHLQEGVFQWRITIPPGTTAVVYVPSAHPDQIKESDQPACRSPGVTFLRSEQDRAVFRIESGSYEFVSPWKP
ncbi:MAG: family 78 glycoside hydrolase catalytic domain [Verrucomicrobiota bacterium]|nr:glycoside hydrolase family 78 protein [Limisphaera sp.]MDW8381362.1 family 78 glycoside hydrolase catalytic domain [Verrucomicrobiota bacterium]